MSEVLPGIKICSWLSGLTATAASIFLGLSINRLLFEGLFPRWTWLGSQLPAAIFTLLFGLLGWLTWRWLALRLGAAKVKIGEKPGSSSSNTSTLDCRVFALSLIPFLPLFLNLFFLFDSRVPLLESRFLTYASVWLALLFLARLLVLPRRWIWLGIVFCLVFFRPIYIITLGQTVGTADTFEFQVTVPQLGIAHPTGYPLYLLLSKPFTWIPINSMAWRVNLATMIFTLSALTVFYLLLYRLTRQPVIAVLTTVVMGLTPTLWSQAVQAEVYSLNALIVVLALLLMREIGRWRLDGNRLADPSDLGNQPVYLSLLLVIILGLGLTNHLTSIILLPGALLTLSFANREGMYKGASWNLGKFVLFLGLAFLLPLILYAYLPIRWSALNQEAMGFNRFIDWVIGGRFQGALQLSTWLQEWERYQILGRLIQAEWPLLWFLPLVLVGAIKLLFSAWRYGLILLVSWLGYVFYGLNYIVPDLAVFLIPSFIIMTIWWGLGVSTLITFILKVTDQKVQSPDIQPGAWSRGSLLVAVIVMILISPFLLAAVNDTWPSVDASVPDGRVQWGQAVLNQPLAAGATILADSDKFPPLYYLQQVEGVRPDLDIVLLPDETAYRAELQNRLVLGDTVYLARFIPGLEGSYRLRSVGPLTEVSQEGMNNLPSEAVLSDLSFGPIRLLGYELSAVSPFKPADSSVTLYWQSEDQLSEVQHVYTRWFGPEGGSQPVSQHPANNYYPTVAWESGEIVSDFHTLPLPAVNENDELLLQVALGPPFTDESELAWQTVAAVQFDGTNASPDLQPQQIRLGQVHLDGASFPNTIRPGDELAVWLSGSAADQDELILTLQPVDTGENKDQSENLIVINIPVEPLIDNRFLHSSLLPTDLPEGIYELIVEHPSGSNKCGWLAQASSGCSLGTITLSGDHLPTNAANFDDKIGLLSVNLNPLQLHPGQLLDVDLQWLSLSPMSEDYTIFLQVLDEVDKIVGQVDSWPLQGTYPTSSWEPGEAVDDAFQIRLDSELPPGPYRLHLGWYLLEDLRRLPVLNESGQAIEDKVEVPGLFVKEDS